MDDTRERILSAALDLFSKKGYAAVPTKAIALAAGVNEVTLFRLFTSKRDLYLAVFERYRIAPNGEAIFAGIRGEAAPDFRAVCRAIVSIFLGNSKIVRMSIKDLELFPEIEAELKSQPAVLAGLIASYLRGTDEGRSWQGKPEAGADLLVSTLMGVTLHLSRFRSEAEVFAFVDGLSDVLFRGMRFQPPRP